MDNTKPLTPMQVLKQHFPMLYDLQLLSMDASVGGGEKKLGMLLDTLVKYNTTKATGSVMVDYSKGRIAQIDTRVRITAGTAPQDEY